MVAHLKQFLHPPVFNDEEDNRIARILHVILLTLFFATALMTFAVVSFSSGLTTLVLLIAMGIMALCYGMLRRGHLRLVGITILLLLLGMTISILVVGFGVHDPAILILPIIVIISGLVLTTRLFVLFTGLTVLSVGLIILLEVNGYVKNAVFTQDSKGLEFAIYATILTVTAVTIHLLTQNLKDNLARAQKADAQWRALVKNAPDLITYLQKDGTIVFLNSVMDEPNADVVGQTVYDYTLPAYHEAVRTAIEQVLATGKPTSYESVSMTRFGDQGVYENRIGPVKQQGKIVGLTMISTNISKRREMEIALEAEREFAQRIIDNMGQGLTITDENGCFIYVNPAYTQMTGHTTDSLLGKTPHDVVPNSARAELEKQKIARQKGKTSSYSSVIQHTDGSILHVLITGVPRWQDDKFTGSIAVVTNLTEQMEAEMERERLITELESRNAELERFTYTVSHDLKSPLITIRGFLGVLRQDLESGDEVGVQTAVHHINNAAKTMDSLLRDLLELSRVGRVINPPEETPFASIAAEAMWRVSGQSKARNAQIIVAEMLPLVVVDRPRLIEVMQNLLDNALKYTPKHTEPVIEVGTTERAGETLFFVRDNGQGIPAAYQEKVFGLFERLDPSVEGTGIGLALAKRIIEVHNGRLWVESEGIGQGSTFYFTLPVVDEQNGVAS